MQSYIARRLLQSMIVMLLVTFLVFLMLQLMPGDPVRMLFGEQVDPERVEQLRQSLGLDDPLYVQFWRFLSDALRGDLGTSIRERTPVTRMIMFRLPYTAQLAASGLGVSLVLGIFLGVIAAIRHGKWQDSLSMFIALVGVSAPSFWLGLMLIFIFSVRLGWFPTTGFGGWDALVLPAVTLGWWAAGTLARLTRSSMLEVMGQDYITVARSKGLAERTVIYKHALRNALLPVITMIGVQTGFMLAGSMIVETVFARPGIGLMLVRAVRGKDFPVVQGGVLFVALVFIWINLLVDISYSWIDPRIRFN